MTKRTEKSGEDGGDKAKRTTYVDRNLHSTPYAMSARELWTGLVIFFIMGVGCGALAFAILLSFHR
jgi:hypothetical protein